MGIAKDKVKGKVYLVGCLEDPKLITLKALEAIQRADVIVYDRLATPGLLLHAKPGSQKIYVGKLPDRHTMKQEEINQLLVDLALEGHVVTRLKGEIEVFLVASEKQQSNWSSIK